MANLLQQVSDDAKAAAGRLEAWLAAKHPGDTEAQALVTEAKGVVAGIEGAVKDVAPLVSDAGSLAIDAAKLAADVAGKSLNLADVVGAGRDGAQAFSDLQAAWADFLKARAAAVAAANS